MRTDLDFLWGSGLWPRFALLTPSELPPWRSPKPGHCDPPQALTRTLRRLAEEKLPKPAYPAAPQTCDAQLGDGVHAAWRAYARAMIHDILTSPEAPDKRLWGVYGRLPGQAFKVAVILAALDWAEGDGAAVPMVSLAHWARGQTIAESWRASAHRLLDSLSNRRVGFLAPQFRVRQRSRIQVAGALVGEITQPTLDGWLPRAPLAVLDSSPPTVAYWLLPVLDGSVLLATASNC
jgi:hypothetical protein